MRRPRESSKKEDTAEKGLKRSSSVKGRSENKVEVISKDTEEKTEQKPEKLKGEKKNDIASRIKWNKTHDHFPKQRIKVRQLLIQLVFLTLMNQIL